MAPMTKNIKICLRYSVASERYPNGEGLSYIIYVKKTST